MITAAGFAEKSASESALGKPLDVSRSFSQSIPSLLARTRANTGRLPEKATRILAGGYEHLAKLLKWRVWVTDHLQPSEWQRTLLWSALAGVLGALAALLFGALTEGAHELLTGSRAGVVESMRQLPSWAVALVPAAGGLIAGVILVTGRTFARAKSSTDYMEAIVIGSGKIPLRSSLVKCGAALFSIGSGGSIGREGPLVQLAAVIASLLGRARRFSAPKQRLIVGCGAAAGIASAYNAPIAGSFFIAEIILGSIAMESLGPLAVAAVAATVTLRTLTGAAHLYSVPAFRLNSPWELGPYLVLGICTGFVAPAFLKSLRQAERLFLRLSWPLPLRLALGGLIVGIIAMRVPEVCGNGYTVVVEILNGRLLWSALLLVFVCKWMATAASFGSGAPGGVFTPSLFVGASIGFGFGALVNALWPLGASDPRAFALVGMGAFLAAASHAPLMAIIMLFEMTLNYDIVLPLMLASVVAYYTAKELEGESLYSAALKLKASTVPPAANLTAHRVADLMRRDPPTLPLTAGFETIARTFIETRVNNLYVVDEDQRFRGAISLHDIKPHLGAPETLRTVIASDILRDDFPRVQKDHSLAEGLEKFLGLAAERLPVVDNHQRLVGSLAKSDLLLTLVDQTQPAASTA